MATLSALKTYHFLQAFVILIACSLSQSCSAFFSSLSHKYTQSFWKLKLAELFDFVFSPATFFYYKITSEVCMYAFSVMVARILSVMDASNRRIWTYNQLSQGHFFWSNFAVFYGYHRQCVLGLEYPYTRSLVNHLLSYESWDYTSS